MRLLLIVLLALSTAGSSAAQSPFADALAGLALPEETIMAGLQQYLLQKVPPLAVPDDVAAWESQADELRNDFLTEIVLKGVPQAWRDHKVQVEWKETIETGHGYVIRKLLYEALPGLWIPALLYEPESGEGLIPAVLNVNGHVGPPGKAIDYEQIKCINQAKRGMLALHPDWFACGELQDGVYGHSKLAYLDLAGVRGLSVFYYALSRAVDLLEAHPRTDRSRIAMTGLSGGGWQTALLSALDERIAAIVPNAGHGAMTNRITSLRDMGDLEQVPSDFLTVGDYSHLTALFAPRPALLIYNAQDNCCFTAATTLPGIYDPVVPVYALYQATAQFQFHINEDPGTHNYEVDNRTQFYRFMARQFLQEQDLDPAEIPSEDEILSEAELTVGIPADNATFQSMALGVLNERPAPGAGTPEALRSIVRYTELRLELAESSEVVLDGASGQAYRFTTPYGPVIALRTGVARAGAPPRVLITDTYWKDIAGPLQDFLKEAGEVYLFAPTLLDGSLPAGSRLFQLAMALDASGQRSLGVQAAEIAAFCTWVSDQENGAAVRLDTWGPMSSAAALVAGAVGPGAFTKLVQKDNLTSLKSLIEVGESWDKFQPLYCFELLKHFDLQQLSGLSIKNGVEL